MLTTLRLGFSYAVFGALMWVSTGLLVLGFSSMSFSTGASSATNDTLIATAQNYAVVGGVVGCAIGVVISRLPGSRGKDLTVISAVLFPVGAFIGSLLFAVAVSLALFVVSLFGFRWFQYQGTIIVTGVWVISAVAVLAVLTSKDGGSSSVTYSYRGGYSGVSSVGGGAIGAAPAGGFGGSDTFHTTRDFFGDGYTTRGSDGTTFHTTRDFLGDGTTTRGSNGVTFHTTRDFLGGGTTTRGSDGTVYHTTKDFLGDGYTTRGSDGSVYHTRDDFFGDGTTTRKG